MSHLTSPLHTPEHNGYSEHRDHHIVETSLSLLSHASMPLSHWYYALSTIVYLINRLPNATLNLISPYHKLFGTPPNYSKLCSFSYLCYPWLRLYSAHKLAPHSSPCVFLGYPSNQSAYFCLDPSTSQMYSSHDVKFVESIFPFTTIQTDVDHPSPVTLSQWCSMSLPIVNTPSSSLGSAPSVLTPSNPCISTP